MLNGAEPPYLAVVANLQAAKLWSAPSSRQSARYVERVEVTYFTKDEERDNKATPVDDSGGAKAIVSTRGKMKKAAENASGKKKRAAAGSKVVPTLQQKVSRHFVSSFNADKLQRLGVHLDNPYYGELLKAIRVLIARLPHLAKKFGKEFDYRLALGDE